MHDEHLQTFEYRTALKLHKQSSEILPRTNFQLLKGSVLQHVLLMSCMSALEHWIRVEIVEKVFDCICNPFNMLYLCDWSKLFHFTQNLILYNWDIFLNKNCKAFSFTQAFKFQHFCIFYSFNNFKAICQGSVNVQASSPSTMHVVYLGVHSNLSKSPPIYLKSPLFGLAHHVTLPQLLTPHWLLLAPPPPLAAKALKHCE